MKLFKNKSEMVSPEQAIRGRDEEMKLPERHLVLGTPLRPPVSGGIRAAPYSRWAVSGVPSENSGSRTACTPPAVGYSGGLTPNTDL